MQDIESYENRIKSIDEAIENIDNDMQNKNNMIGVINNLFNTKSFERNDILQLIDKIEIGAKYQHPKIKIHFNFLV